MSKNFTQGYGPVEYLTRDASEGTYHIKVKLFSPKVPRLFTEYFY